MVQMKTTLNRKVMQVGVLPLAVRLQVYVICSVKAVPSVKCLSKQPFPSIRLNPAVYFSFMQPFDK